MSPRKSSTSSAKPPPSRPRYLGIEVAGEPSLSPQRLQEALRLSLACRLPRVPPLRVVRIAGSRAIVEVPHTVLDLAREAWNGEVPTSSGQVIGLATRRTWGTLVKAKAWLRARPPSGRISAIAPAR